MGGRIDSCIYWPGHNGGAGVQPASSKLGSGNASRAVGAEATPVLMELCFRASEGLFVRPGGACLRTAGRPLLLAFGISTGWDEEDETVSYGERELRVGAVVQAGGSAGGRREVSMRWLVSPAPECERELIWFVAAAPIED